MTIPFDFKTQYTLSPNAPYDPSNPDCAQFANKDDALIPGQIIVNPDPAVYDTARELQRTVTGMTVTPGGRIYTSYFTSCEHLSEDDGNYCMLFSSDDNAASWQLRLVIEPPFRDHTRAFDCYPWIDDRGRFWLFWSQSYSWDGRQGAWAAYCDDPDSSAPHFSQPRRIGNGIVSAKPVILPDGAWILPACLWDVRVATECNLPKYFLNWLPDEHGTNLLRSTDRGMSWERIANVHWGFENFPESNVVPLSDGRLWMLIRGMNCTGQSFSEDGGWNWSIPRENRKLPLPDTKFSLTRLKSGNLLLVCNYKADMFSYYCGRNHLTAMISRDDGKTWEGKLLLDAREGAEQPDACQSADGRIFVSYGRAPCFVGESLLAEFTEEDVLAGRPVSPEARLRIHVGRAGGIEKRPDYAQLRREAEMNGIEMPEL